MKEIASFFLWIIAVMFAVTAIHQIASYLGVTADIAVLLSCFPLIVVMSIGTNEDSRRLGTTIIRAVAWFYGAFVVLLLTSFLLSMIV